MKKHRKYKKIRKYKTHKRKSFRKKHGRKLEKKIKRVIRSEAEHKFEAYEYVNETLVNSLNAAQTTFDQPG